MMDKMFIYDASRNVPEEAKKQITAGRLKGFTDINPMWRIKKLTELFGPCGIGWYPRIVRTWIDEGNDVVTDFGNGKVMVANMEILLFVKYDDCWSEGIPGIGGSTFVANEKSGLYTSDEAYKMAYTDAISVACKLLGFGADVYWDKDRTKYMGNVEAAQNGAEAARKAPQKAEELPTYQPRQQSMADVPRSTCSVCGKGITAAEERFSKSVYDKPLCRECQKVAKK